MASASNHLSLIELAGLGREELAAMYQRDELGLQELWLAADGAKDYAIAVASGDLVEPHEHLQRSRKCSACPKAQRTQGRPDDRGRPVEKIWCGAPFKGPPPQCGCLVALSVGGEILPGALTAVASESCPDPEPLWTAAPRLAL